MSNTASIPNVPSDGKKTLTGFVRNLLILNGYAQAIQQIDISNTSNQEPDWFPTFKKNISAAKEHANNWNLNIETAIATEVPNIIMNLGNDFEKCYKEISDILNNCNLNPDDNQKNSIFNKLSEVNDSIKNKYLEPINTLCEQFQSFQKDVYTDFTDLENGKDNITNTINFDKSKIDKLNADITTQDNNISADKNVIEEAGVAGGIGFFLGAGVMCLGPIGMIFGGLVMLGAVTEFATVAGIYSTKINEAQTQINQDISEIGDDNQQIASLIILSNSIKKLVDTNSEVYTALSSVAVWCKEISKEFDEFYKSISDSAKDFNSNNWQDMKEELDSAASDWNIFSVYASDALGSIINTSVSLTYTPEAQERLNC